MRKIVYYVATSLDGFISGPDGDISGFAGKGSGVNQYLSDLQDYDTVLMGRNTYEFGYEFGLEPGQLAYPHMQHFIISTSLSFEKQDESLYIIKPDLSEIRKIREQSGTDIYLCGGGQFAGWLLDNQQIDILKIKLNPLLLGSGVSLFGPCKRSLCLKLLSQDSFEHGLQIITYKINYAS